MEPGAAAALGVYLHGLAGDRLLPVMGDAGMLATDLLRELPVVRRELCYGRKCPMLKAKDIMTRKFIPFVSRPTIKELAAFLSKPSQGDAGSGWRPDIWRGSSLNRLVEQDKPLHMPTVISLFDWVLYLESEKNFREEVKRISARTVGEICAREVITCTPETPVNEIAALMVEHQVHLVPVVEGERVVGVVARLDIIRSMGT